MLPGPQRRLEQGAHERVALRVRATEDLERTPDRQQFADHLVVPALTEAEHGAARRKADHRCHADVRPDAIAVDIAGEFLDVALGLCEPTGTDERHDPVKVVEHVPRRRRQTRVPRHRRARRTVRPCRGRRAAIARAARWRRASRAERRPTSRCAPRRRRSPAPRAVSPTSRRYRARCHQLCTVNRLPLPQSASRSTRKRIPSSTRPCISRTCTTAWTRPDVVGVHLERLQPRGLGRAVVTRLFEAEGLHATHETRVRMLRVQGGKRAAGSVAQVGRVADEEVELVTELQREQVGRPAQQESSRAAPAPSQSPADPRADRLVMSLLTLVHRKPAHGFPAVLARSRRRGSRCSTATGRP